MYWAGPLLGTEYELTETDSGNVFVRYLPAGTKVGTSTHYRFVATFPVLNAFAVTSQIAGRASSVKLPVPGGGVAFYTRSLPTTAYVAFPGSDDQIEVYDPSPPQLRRLITSGQVRPLP